MVSFIMHTDMLSACCPILMVTTHIRSQVDFFSFALLSLSLSSYSMKAPSSAYVHVQADERAERLVHHPETSINWHFCSSLQIRKMCYKTNNQPVKQMPEIENKAATTNKKAYNIKLFTSQRSTVDWNAVTYILWRHHAIVVSFSWVTNNVSPFNFIWHSQQPAPPAVVYFVFFSFFLVFKLRFFYTLLGER